MKAAESYPVKVALLKVDVPCPLGYTYSAETLERVAVQDEMLEFDGETLWFRNDKSPRNVTVTCRQCEQEFVTAIDNPGQCPRCGGARKLEVAR